MSKPSRLPSFHFLNPKNWSTRDPKITPFIMPTSIETVVSNCSVSPSDTVSASPKKITRNHLTIVSTSKSKEDWGREIQERVQRRKDFMPKTAENGSAPPIPDPPSLTDVHRSAYRDTLREAALLKAQILPAMVALATMGEEYKEDESSQAFKDNLIPAHTPTYRGDNKLCRLCLSVNCGLCAE